MTLGTTPEDTMVWPIPRVTRRRQKRIAIVSGCIFVAKRATHELEKRGMTGSQDQTMPCGCFDSRGTGVGSFRRTVARSRAKVGR